MTNKFDELAAKAGIALRGRTLAQWKIDLSPLDTLRALSIGQFRIDVEDKWNCAQIFYDGEWIKFGRTDLKDDVATQRRYDDMDKLLRRVAEYLERGVFGARIRNRRGKRWFEIIDRFSDG